MNSDSGQKRNTRFWRLVPMALAVVILEMPGSSLATIRTWGGGGAVSSFMASDAANWVEGEAPVAGNAIILDARTAKNMTWDLNLPVQSWTQVGYTGTVTVQTVYPGQGAFTNFAILGDCVISNGVWTHAANGTSEGKRLHAIIGGNLVIGPGATIDVTGKGYTENNGPGAPPVISGGGSYGGVGTFNNSPGACYGAIVAPTNLGSAARGNTGRAGGGAVILAVSGAVRVDGAIRAESYRPANCTGSGGSVFLTAGALIGSGLISVSARNGNWQAGGGGRVALVVTNAGADFAGFTGPIMAYGGKVSTYGGGAGTIYHQRAADRPGYGTVTLDNDNLTISGYAAMLPYTGYVSGEVDRAPFHVANAAQLRLTDDLTVGDIWLDTANAVLDLGSNTLTVNTRKHDLGPGAVANYGAIIWTGLPPGVLIIVK